MGRLPINSQPDFDRTARPNGKEKRRQRHQHPTQADRRSQAAAAATDGAWPSVVSKEGANKPNNASHKRRPAIGPPTPAYLIERIHAQGGVEACSIRRPQRANKASGKVLSRGVVGSEREISRGRERERRGALGRALLAASEARRRRQVDTPLTLSWVCVHPIDRSTGRSISGPNSID